MEFQVYRRKVELESEALSLSGSWCFFAMNSDCLRLPQSISTIFHLGVIKPKVVFASGSLCFPRGISMDSDCMKISQSIETLSTKAAADWKWRCSWLVLGHAASRWIVAKPVNDVLWISIDLVRIRYIAGCMAIISTDLIGKGVYLGVERSGMVSAQKRKLYLHGFHLKPPGVTISG